MVKTTQIATLSKVDTGIVVYDIVEKTYLIYNYNDGINLEVQKVYSVSLKGDTIVEIKSQLDTISDEKYRTHYDKAIKEGAIDEVEEAEIIEGETAIAAYVGEKNEEPEMLPLSTPASEMSRLPSLEAITEMSARLDHLKRSFIKKSDTQLISGKRFLKKSAYRKLANGFGLKVEIIKREERIYDAGNKDGWEFEVWARATAPNGQSVEAIGLCQQHEKNRTRTKHDTLTTASTRAKNRAIADLVAFGEVSAEEITG